MEVRVSAPVDTPAICSFEVLRGSVRTGDESYDRTRGFLRSLTVLEMDLEATDVAAELDDALHIEGTPQNERDTLVASPVHENPATLVTRDRGPGFRECTRIGSHLPRRVRPEGRGPVLHSFDIYDRMW